MTVIFVVVNGLILTIFVLIIGLAIAVRQNKQLRKELQSHRKHIE